MLVLSRKRLQQIVIGSGIRITVVKVEGSHVRLGIEAPDGLAVLRAELLTRPAKGERIVNPISHPRARPKG